jgi:Helix-turn-helix
MGSYAEQVGERLRNIRLQKGLSLHDVEERSGKEFKASVLGAYERGERSISVPRLQRLAIFYGVPVDHLLPRVGAETNEGDGGGGGAAVHRPGGAGGQARAGGSHPGPLPLSDPDAARRLQREGAHHPA